MKRDAQGQSGQHALEAVAGIPAGVVVALRGQWITTAEEVLAIHAIPESRAHLRKLLGFDDSAYASFINALEAAVGPEGLKAISASVQMPGKTGALLTDDQRKRFGIG